MRTPDTLLGAEPLVTVRCAVCGGERHETVCPAPEVRAHLAYLRRFHRRRLCPTPAGGRAALADRADFTQDYVTDIVACAACGLVFRNPRPAAPAITRAYADDRYGRPRLEALFGAQLEFYRAKARHLRRRLPAARRVRVVEVGSFVGGFLAAGEEQGWDMLGIDPGAEVHAFCRARGLRVLRGTITDAPLTPESADCVAIWNAFDQLPHPEATLSAARHILRPGGVLVLRVPNGACFRSAMAWARRLPRALAARLYALLAWNNLLAFPYLYGYSTRTLDRLLARHAFGRVWAVPDTLLRLADAQTKRWAAWEERALKSLCRWVARVDAFRPASPLTLAPWFDAYYRLF